MSNSQEDSSPVGGVIFFISLLALATLVGINTLSLYVIIDHSAVLPLSLFFMSLAVGFYVARLAIVGHLSVLIHEFKHSVLSGLAGNKAKGMRVRKDHGHFEYAYTKSTAHMNAFIALAPYWLPLFTVLFVATSFIFTDNHMFLACIAGLAFGADCSCNARDLSPHQTDLTQIRGGFTISVVYLTLINLFTATIIIAWVAAGFVGIKVLGLGLVHFARIVSGY